MDTTTFLSSLLDEISEDEKSLARKRAVADFMRERIKRDEAAVIPSSGAVIPSTQMLSPFTSTATATATDSFSEQVLKAVQDLYHHDFSVRDVYRTLVEKGVTFNSATPKASIATALGRLEKTGVIAMTYKGSGKTPNRFRRAEDVQQVAEQQQIEKEDDEL